MITPDDKDFDMVEWKKIHNTHFSSPEHVSKSKFALFFGSVDKGTKLHIPAAGEARIRMLRKEEQAAQRIRCNALRSSASK